MNKSFFQRFIINTIHSLLTILRIAIMSKWFVSGFKNPSKHKAALILGNGPSLKDTISKHPDFLKDKTLVCVNHFAETEYYRQLKPEMYVLGAPEMWRNDVETFHLNKGKNLFKQISERTEWPLKLFIPVCSKGYKDWQLQIKKNPKIEIVFFNNTPGEGSVWFEHFVFNKNWAMPRPHNVLIPSLMIALNLKYKKIYISGADHSWMKDVYVSDENRVFLTQKHFYDYNTAEQKTMDNRGNGERHLHEILEKWMLAFQGYFTIRRYAESRNQSIINITPDSYIDAFEREQI